MKVAPWVVGAVLAGVAVTLHVRGERQKEELEDERRAKLRAFDEEQAKAVRAADEDAFQLARTIRRLYPLLREADSGDVAGAVERFKRQPSPAGPCATEMQRAVADELAAALADAAKPKDGKRGIHFDVMHASYRPCSDRLFRVRMGQTPTAAGAGTYLGVRDDEPKAQPIHEGLFTLSKRPIDAAALGE